MIGSLLISFGMLLIFLGFLVIAIGTPGTITGQEDIEREHGAPVHGTGIKPEKTRPEVKGGGVIMIGPIPIIFGTDRRSAETAIILAIILMFLALAVLR